MGANLGRERERTRLYLFLHDSNGRARERHLAVIATASVPVRIVAVMPSEPSAPLPLCARSTIAISRVRARISAAVRRGLEPFFRECGLRVEPGRALNATPPSASEIERVAAIAAKRDSYFYAGVRK
jgi:hypothetical protein